MTQEQRRFTRREFIWGVGTAGGALAAVEVAKRLGISKAKDVVGEYEYLFQVGLPPGYALVRAGWFDSVEKIGEKSKVSVEQLKRENGIGDDNKITSGEYLLVPISAGATAHYVENDDSDLEKQLTVRAVQNPLLPLEKDFTNQETMVLNGLLRWAEGVKKKYMGDIDTTRGFARLMRATESEMSYDPARVSGQVSTIPTCSFPLPSGDPGIEATIECKSEETRVIMLYPGASSLKAYKYFESLQPGYGMDRYMAYMANMVLHERLHMAIWADLEIPPFDNHRLIYAVASLADDAFPDRGYVVDGHKVGGGFYDIDSVEWYLIRQSPDFFRKLLPRYLEYYQKQPPTPEEVNRWMNKIDPSYIKWKEMYDAPIAEEKVSKEGKSFIWNGKKGVFNQVTWAVPVYSVRRPRADETGWLIDWGFPPIRKDGMLLYRSWKVVGVSEAGEVPDFVDTAMAMAFSGDDPNSFSNTGDGRKQINPTAEAVYQVGEWR